ncbi:MAG: hypothetical protein CMM48_12710 [Rhodospirillaceae bacterium]|nr:hypothetical protein [Rhodospirillaceae bacterium]
MGDQWRDLEKQTVTLPVKLGPITLPIRRTIYRSVHGPVIKNDNGYFAVRYGGMGNLGQLDAYYRLNKATDLDEFQAILARMDIPSTNFIYGDEDGNIAFIYNAALPDRAKGYASHGTDEVSEIRRLCPNAASENGQSSKIPNRAVESGAPAPLL